MIVRIDGISVAIENGSAMWIGGMDVDADGSPRAYSLPGSALVGLDYIGNAGKPGDWYGLACDESGTPYVQTLDDPCPGYPVSSTAAQDHGFQPRDPRRYVNSETVPYIVISESFRRITGGHLGDLVICSYKGKTSGACIADIGPGICEGSIALHKALGVDPQRALPKHKLVGIDSGVTYMVFLGSAAIPPWPRNNVSAAAIALAATRPK